MRLAGAIKRLCCVALFAPAGHAADVERSGGPYVPTPHIIVGRMLRMGVEIDPDLVKQSNDAARKFGVADRVRFVQQDVFKADLSEATVVTLYLLPGTMLSLMPKFYAELRPGARIVSHDYHFNDWAPDNQITFDVSEKERIAGGTTTRVYLLIVPAKVAGVWQVRLPASGEEYRIALRQQ